MYYGTAVWSKQSSFPGCLGLISVGQERRHVCTCLNFPQKVWKPNSTHSYTYHWNGCSEWSQIQRRCVALPFLYQTVWPHVETWTVLPVFIFRRKGFLLFKSGKWMMADCCFWLNRSWSMLGTAVRLSWRRQQPPPTCHVMLLIARDSRNPGVHMWLSHEPRRLLPCHIDGGGPAHSIMCVPAWVSRVSYPLDPNTRSQ